MSRRLSFRLRGFLRSQDGATAIEYGMIAAMIAAIIVGGVGTLGSNMSTIYDKVAAAFSN